MLAKVKTPYFMNGPDLKKRIKTKSQGLRFCSRFLWSDCGQILRHQYGIFCRWVAEVLPCETSPAAGSKEERRFSQTIASVASDWFLKKNGLLIKTNKSPVLAAKVQDMTDRYDFAKLHKQIFFSNWKYFLSSLYFIYLL